MSLKIFVIGRFLTKNSCFSSFQHHLSIQSYMSFGSLQVCRNWSSLTHLQNLCAQSYSQGSLLAYRHPYQGSQTNSVEISLLSFLIVVIYVFSPFCLLVLLHTSIFLLFLRTKFGFTTFFQLSISFISVFMVTNSLFVLALSFFDLFCFNFSSVLRCSLDS